MSLINQMLKDLESRQNRKSGDKASAINGLNSAPDKKQPKVSKKFLLTTIPVFLVLLYMLFPTASDRKNLSTQNKTIPASPATVSGATTTAPVAVPSPVSGVAPTVASSGTTSGTTISDLSTHSQELFSAIVQNGSPPSLTATEPEATLPMALTGQSPVMNTMTDVKVNIEDTQAAIVMNFKSPVYYDFERNPDLMMITLKMFNVLLDPSALNNFPNNAFIKSIKVEHQGNDSLITVVMRDGVDLSSLDATQRDGKSAVSLQFQSQKNMSNGVSSMMQKVVVPLTPEQLAEKAREDAIILVEQGKINEATHLLSKALAELPTYRPARETLAILLMDQRQIESAHTLLKTGLHDSPNYVPFIVLQARIFIATNRNDEALALLESVSPDIRQAPDYFALLAGLEQRKGNYGVAEQIYQQLVRMNPENGAWWMGYGVALESLGIQNKAKEAYKHAIMSGNLPATLQVYASDRLTILGG